ncbi:hypothetical protein GCM10027030_22720 [Luteococcus sediminum]
MGRQCAEFLEGGLVQQEGEPLPGGHLPLGVLGVDPVWTASGEGLFAHPAKGLESLRHCLVS